MNSCSAVPQLQTGFDISWKLSLNLWNQRWPNPSLSLVSSFKSLGLWDCKVLFVEDLMRANMRLLKSSKLSEFVTLGSKLFLCIIVEGKKEILKQSCLTLKRGILFLCLVTYACLAVGISSKRYLEDWFFIILKKRQSFPYHGRWSLF